MKRVAVLGAGSWGSALSIVLADNNHEVRLWTHRQEQADTINQTHKNEQYLDIMIPKQIKAYSDMGAAIKDVDAILIVVPSKAMREVCQELDKHLKHKPIIVHAAKGIEPKTLYRVSEVIGEEIKSYSENEVVVLSGPSHAEEVAQHGSFRKQQQ